MLYSLEEFMEVVEKDDTALEVAWSTQQEQVRQAETRVEEARRNVDRIADAGSAMTALANAVNSAVDAGEETQTMDTLLRVAIGQINDGNDIAVSMPSLESTTDLKERVLLSLESIKDTIVELLKRLKEAAIRAMTAFLNFLDRLADQIRVAKVTFQKTIEALKQLEDWQTIDSFESTYGNKMAVKGVVSRSWANDVMGIIRKVAKSDNLLIHASSEMHNNVMPVLETALEKKKADIGWPGLKLRLDNYVKIVRDQLSGLADLPGGYSVVVEDDPTVVDRKLYSLQLLASFTRKKVRLEKQDYPDVTSLPMPSSKADLLDHAEAGFELANLILVKQRDKVAAIEEKEKIIEGGFLTRYVATGGDPDSDDGELIRGIVDLLRLPSEIIVPTTRYLSHVLPAYATALYQCAKEQKKL